MVAYQKSVRVRKHGDAKKYNAHVIHVAHECDLAMVSVDDNNFWDGLEALELGEIPMLEEDVVVVGFPTGGDNISVTRGVVSRVDIQRYSHSGVISSPYRSMLQSTQGIVVDQHSKMEGWWAWLLKRCRTLRTSDI